MVGQDEFWSLAQEMLGDEQAQAPPREQVLSEQAPYEEQSVQVKATEDDEWGGHAWPVVALDNHEGWSINSVGAKSNLTYYFVESTAYYEGSSDIGVNPWYEITDEAFYDVEE